MKIIVIGLGSMGKRRIRLLKKVRPQDSLIGIDKNAERCKLVEAEFNIETSGDLTMSLKKSVDYAFVCTSPLSHAQIIKQCLEADVSVFTEINLVTDLYNENMELAAKRNKILYLSSTPLFRNEMIYITNRVQNYSQPLSYNYHVGQYLPDWHPWEYYNNFFIGDKRTNGCREILAIELPWMVKCFGPIKSVQVISGKNTLLNVDYPDNYSILITHTTGHHGVLMVDVVCRKPVRFLEICGENIYLTWNGSTEGLLEYDIDKKEEHPVCLYEQVEHMTGYNSLIVENAYESEVIDFFEVVENKKLELYSFEQDKIILEWIDKCEENV